MTDNLPTVSKTHIPMVEGKGLQPADFDGLWRLSTVMTASGVLPRDLRTPEATFVVLNMGAELGLSPMAAVQNISVINGRPVVWGDALLGLVRASGILTSFSETFTGDFPSDDFTAVCTCHRGDEEITRTFSIEDAKAAGLWKYPQQGTTPWCRYPKRMLQMRARSWALRDGFGDVLKGIAAREELEPGFDADTRFDEEGQVYEPVTPEGEITTEPVNTDPEPDLPDFAALVSGQDPDQHALTLLDRYLEHINQEKGTGIDDIKVIAAANFDRFWGSFQQWIQDQEADNAEGGTT